MRPSLRESHPLIVDRSTDASLVDPIHVSQTDFPLRAAQHLILSLGSELRRTIVRVERRLLLLVIHSDHPANRLWRTIGER